MNCINKNKERPTIPSHITVLTLQLVTSLFVAGNNKDPKIIRSLMTSIWGTKSSQKENSVLLFFPFFSLKKKNCNKEGSSSYLFISTIFFWSPPTTLELSGIYFVGAFPWVSVFLVVLDGGKNAKWPFKEYVIISVLFYFIFILV